MSQFQYCHNACDKAGTSVILKTRLKTNSLVVVVVVFVVVVFAAAAAVYSLPSDRERERERERSGGEEIEEQKV